MAEIQFSENVSGRNVKILLWGAPATYKTETGLRHFPNCLLIDCEGNSDQVLGHPDIDPFLRVVTKDVYEILDIFDQVEEGEITMPDGEPVETVIIDGASVLWSVRQETGSLMAEERAKRYARGGNVDPDDVNMTQLDWVKAKRPMKRLHARLNAPGIKYLILTAREKDNYKEVKKPNGSTELVKDGVTIDAMRGLDYEVNIAFHMMGAEGAEVTKAQGQLGQMFPVGTKLDEFPAERILDYATGGGTRIEDDLEVAEKQAERETTHTQRDLLDIGRKHDLDAAQVAQALKENGIENFDADRWGEMVTAVESFAGSDNGAEG